MPSGWLTAAPYNLLANQFSPAAPHVDRPLPGGTATDHQEEDGDDLTPYLTPYNPPPPPERATTTPFCPGTAPYSAAPSPREHDATTQSRLGTTSIDQPSATPLKLAPPLVDRPLPAAAATDHPEEGDYQEADGDDPTRPEIPDTEAESMAKNAIPVTPILAFLQEYESAQVLPLSRLTKEDSDAALAVRLCTGGKTTATRDDYWLFKDN